MIRETKARSRRSGRSGRSALVAGTLTAVLVAPAVARAEVGSVAELIAAVNDGAPGDIVLIGPGVFELTAALRPKSGMQIRGAGMGVTIVRNAAAWAPAASIAPQRTPTARPDPGCDTGQRTSDPTIREDLSAAAAHQAVASRSRSRLSRRTLTRGSPSSPNVRSSVCRSTRACTSASVMRRARATRAYAFLGRNFASRRGTRRPANGGGGGGATCLASSRASRRTATGCQSS